MRSAQRVEIVTSIRNSGHITSSGQVSRIARRPRRPWRPLRPSRPRFSGWTGLAGPSRLARRPLRPSRPRLASWSGFAGPSRLTRRPCRSFLTGIARRDHEEQDCSRNNKYNRCCDCACLGHLALRFSMSLGSFPNQRLRATTRDCPYGLSGHFVGWLEVVEGGGVGGEDLIDVRRRGCPAKLRSTYWRVLGQDEVARGKLDCQRMFSTPR